ncbi:gp53-like domain-containing protein [Providencia rettgeri]|uniref:gp53-like domain-containing protein n=1 Tax=Providencia rettgeri TaxID=587 RepID=UPI003F959FC6
MSQKAVTDLFANTAKNTALKAANGWWKCGDTGLIYQWGRITTVNNKFPIAFPNAITSIVISPTSGTLSSQRIGVFNITSFEATFEYGNNTGFYFAVGY